jgi:hypothetical protein
MKKIALFTCHNDPNYGSMLQAYALVYIIRKLGKDAEYLDYKTYRDPRTLKSKFLKLLSFPFRYFKNFFCPHLYQSEFSFFKTADFADTIAAFERFHNEYIPVSSRVYYADTIRKELNVDDYCNYIVGSDQLWSPHLYHPQKPYFLDFADLPKRCAYAPSFGTTILKDKYVKILTEKLKVFDYLSCREAINSRLLSKILNRKVEHVLDPTLLLSKDEWCKIATFPLIGEKYILAYILGEKENIVKFARYLGQKKNLPVFFIVTRPKYLSFENSLKGIGPSDFIGLIKGAEIVITDSFHACLFSINFNIQFYGFSKRAGDINVEDNARILEFLTLLGIENRFQGETAEILSDIDYTVVNKKIDGFRKSSLKYLEACVNC